MQQKLKNPKVINELIYIRAYEDFDFFVQHFFAEHCTEAFSEMHRDFIAAEKDPARRGRREVIAAPRGHAKTTFKALFKVLHAIVYDYETFIVVIGHSAPEAEDKVKDILEELETNERLIEVYGALAPRKGKYDEVGRWGTKDFITRNNIRVLAKSKGKQVRGLKHGPHRPSFIILDDVESAEKVLTEEQRYKTKQWFEKDILKMGRIDGKTNITMIGTCLHPESLLSTLLCQPGWDARKYQAVHAFAKNEALWQQWKALWIDLTNPNREQEADAFFEKNREAMLEGTEVLWPDKEPYYQLMKILVNEGQASFQSEKQNDPYDPERQLFNMERVKRFRVEWGDGNTIKALHWLDGSGRVIPGHHLDRIVAFHDPAMANTKDSDYAALVVCASDLNGFLYCLDAYIEKVPPSRQIEQAFALHLKWRFDTLYLESNHFQGLLEQSYREKQEQHSNLIIVGVHQHQNKQNRISTLEPLLSNGQLLLAEDISQRLWTQLTLFPTSYDDGPDALHGAVEQLRRPRGGITQVVAPHIHL